jgi:hypothetical protein
MERPAPEAGVTVSIPPADDEAAISSSDEEARLRPKPVHDDDSWPGIRWGVRWLLVVVSPARVEGRSTRKLASYLRWATFVLVGAGVGFAKVTPGRIVPISIQLLVVLAVLTFLSVGFWMLHWPDVRTNVIGWIFCGGGAMGALVYAAATYSNLALDEGWVGGVVAGWAADVLFLPSIAVFASFLLASIPTGHWRESQPGRFTVVCGGIAAAFLLVGMAFEPRLVSHPGEIPGPLAEFPFAGWWAAAVFIGLVLLIVSIAVGFDAARKHTSMHNASKWYGYGGAFALLALVPYLLVTLAEWQMTPRAASAARAGVAALALIALAAIPATVGEPWRPARMKRLVRGAVIASIAAAIHELLVHSAVERVVSGSEPDPQLGGQFVFTYELTLLAIAVLFEPFAMAFDVVSERVAYWRSPAHDLLEEGLDDLRASRTRLNRAMARATRLAKAELARGGERSNRRSVRQERKAREIQAVLTDIHRESSEADSLIELMESELPKLVAGSSTDP